MRPEMHNTIAGELTCLTKLFDPSFGWLCAQMRFARASTQVASDCAQFFCRLWQGTRNLRSAGTARLLRVAWRHATSQAPQGRNV